MGLPPLAPLNALDERSLPGSILLKGINVSARWCIAKAWDAAFVGQHGSWNRNPLSGYKVIFVPFRNSKPAGRPRDILTSFVNERGEALGRPVGVARGRRAAGG
jgi:hypothetical protein